MEITNNIPEVIGQAQQYVDWALGLGPELFTIFAFIGFGIVLKISKFPNDYIPLAVIVVATLFYTTVVGNQLAPHWVANPIPWKACVGSLLGLISWGLHHVVLKKWIDPWLPKKEIKQNEPAGY